MSHLRVACRRDGVHFKVGQGLSVVPRDGSDESIRRYYVAAGCGVAAADFLVGDILGQLHTCSLRSLHVSECIAYVGYRV
jgi:hypothetical protein